MSNTIKSTQSVELIETALRELVLAIGQCNPPLKMPIALRAKVSKARAVIAVIDGNKVACAGDDCGIIMFSDDCFKHVVPGKPDAYLCSTCAIKKIQEQVSGV